MNFTDLKYVIEIDKYASISMAAKKLYIAQSNLSRSVKKLENEFDIVIFERTPKGIITTREGQRFLNHAKEILYQVNNLTKAYSDLTDNGVSLRISVPRASYISEVFSEYLNTLSNEENLRIHYYETNSMKTIQNVLDFHFDIGIIRYNSMHEGYFLSLLKLKKLDYRLILEFDYLLLTSKKSIIADKHIRCDEDLENCIEVVYGDERLPSGDYVDLNETDREERMQKKVIYVYSKGNHFEILDSVPNTYMWVSPVALKELKDVYNRKKAFIVTDTFLYKNGYTKPITERLDSMGITHHTFFEVTPDPTLACAKAGLVALKEFEPDVIIAVGGGSAMDASKIMWIMYEHPEADFSDLAMRFMDIRKRVYTFPKMGEKAILVCIATTSGTGSEVTPFTIITDDTVNIKYSIADYSLLPTMAISAADMMMDQPKGLTSSSGIDSLTHALEAYASMMATDYTDGLALRASKLVFDYLPRAYKYGRDDVEAREKMANASTMAGIAFANAFLGVCHSMAHKLGATHHVPHGVANALLINEVIKFNSAESPKRMGTFPQYKYPHTLHRYAEVATYLGFPGKTDYEKVESLIAKIEELKATIGIPKSIKEYGIDEKEFLDKLDTMSEQAFDDQCTSSNPRYPLIEEIKEMYLSAYYGK